MKTDNSKIDSPFVSCDEPGCTLHIAQIIEFNLIIQSRHHGRVHRSRISRERLEKLLTKEEKPVYPSPDAVLA